MSDLIELLDSIEKLAYKILLWVILIPKTLWRTITDPPWVPNYVKGELRQQESPFDEYISPVFLLLIIGLVPALLTTLLPTYGIVIGSPAEAEPTTERVLEFDAEATFISSSMTVADEYRWYVEKITTDETGRFQYDESGNLIYPEIYRETYNESTNRTTILDHDTYYEQEGEVWTVLSSNQGDSSSQDAFIYQFEGAGDYYVNVEAVRFDQHRNDVPLEEYFSYVYVYVPEDPEEQISIINSGLSPQNPQTNETEAQQLKEFLTGETPILLALIFMTPPLLFAFATKFLAGEKISENSLKENFYSQCYYFSPLCLTIWATLFGLYFYTIDIFSYNDLYSLTLLLPLTLAGFWFIYAETYAISMALKVSGWKSLIIVIACLTIFMVGIMIILILTSVGLRDDLRKAIIWAYPLVFYLILVGIMLARLIGWVSGKKRFSVADSILFISLLPSTFVFMGVNLVGLAAGPDTPTATAIYPSAPLLVVTATPIPTETALISVETNDLSGSPALGSNPTTYVIHRGEFPYCIARRFNVHPAQLLASSGLMDGQAIPEGTMLYIPQSSSPFPGNRSLRSHPTTYLVIASDETLYSIACLFGDTDPIAIASANGVSADAALSIGQQLQIP